MVQPDRRTNILILLIVCGTRASPVDRTPSGFIGNSFGVRGTPSGFIRGLRPLNPSGRHSTVVEICIDNETPLFRRFWPILGLFWAYFSYNWPTQNGLNFSKVTKKVWLHCLDLAWTHQVDITPLRPLIISKTSKKGHFWRFSPIFPVFWPYFV